MVKDFICLGNLDREQISVFNNNNDDDDDDDDDDDYYYYYGYY